MNKEKLNKEEVILLLSDMIADVQNIQASEYTDFNVLARQIRQVLVYVLEASK